MANPNAPSGLSPVAHLNGSKWNGQAHMYCILSADGNAYSVGDPVKTSANADANGIPAVTLASAGSPFRGVIVAVGTNAQGGPFIDPTNLTLVSIPATKTKNYYVAVVDSPDVIFEIQEVNSGTAGTATSMNKNANFVYAAPAAGVAVSGVTLDNTTYATTSTLNLRVMGVVQRPYSTITNTPFALAQRLLVLINSHDLAGNTAGT